MAVESSHWDEVIKSISISDALLEATLASDYEAVARGIDEVHMNTISVLQYNNENSLSCVISLAYYSARKDYIMYRELPAGKGFADIVFIPRRYSDKPAIIVELKWDKTAEGAIKQIKEKNYSASVEQYNGEIILVGINYNKKSKNPEWVIHSV